jgi:hypothetical protein
MFIYPSLAKEILHQAASHELVRREDKCEDN